MKLFVFLLLLAASLSPVSATAAPVRTEHVEAELLSARTAAEPGRTLTVALRLRMIPHWHTYWRNPGDSGQPTQLEWRLPPGWQAGAIQWPAPRRLPAGPLMNFGYEDEVLLLTDIAVPANGAGSSTATIAARASWLVCNEERCIPEEGELALSLPVGGGEATAHAAAIERVRAALPAKAGTDWKFAARRTADGVDLEIGAPLALKTVSFFPFEEGKISNPAPQALENSVLRIRKAEQPVGSFNRVAGLLVADGQPMEIDVPVALAPSASGLASLALAAAFAFLGGLILNLMPCVLPVLSIKILGLASRAENVRLHGVLYGAGVLASFLGFAALLLALKSAGSEIGWGFQLQSPLFVGLLAALFLALALNLSGLFEFGSVLPSRLANLGAGHGKTDAFLTGVLAVAVASPCTAPFMGAALGFALAGGPLEALTVFAALGAGMALPYMALAWNPRWLKWLPRPGAWMNRFKQVLAVPLYATVLWLGWVLALQTGALSAASDWEKFSPERLQQYEKQGKPVFVDFTAAWCVTCQVNKQLVLGQADVERDMRAAGYVLMRADWTRRDAEITRALDALGRKGVPVYAIYRPGREPQLLPEILTRDLLFTALKPPS